MASNNKPYLEQEHLHAKPEHRAALLTYPGNLREALRQAQEDPKKTLFGVGQGIPSVAVTKVLVASRPDFIWIDLEHCPLSRRELYDAVQTAQHHSEGRTLVIVRVAKGDVAGLITALDAGASGIILPHTDSAADVKHMINEVFYPPVGQRSFSPWTFTPGITDSSLYEDDAFNMQTSNKHVCLFPQIESVKGLENLDEIASCEGISGLMFGPGDYCADAGIQFKSMNAPPPELFEAMGKFMAGAKKHGLPVLGGGQPPEMAPMMVQQGFSAIVVLMDVWGLTGLVKQNVETARTGVIKAFENKDN